MGKKGKKTRWRELPITLGKSVDDGLVEPRQYHLVRAVAGLNGPAGPGKCRNVSDVVRRKRGLLINVYILLLILILLIYNDVLAHFSAVSNFLGEKKKKIYFS